MVVLLFGMFGFSMADAQSTYDLNSDGKVDVGDVTQLVSSVLDGSESDECDLNGDGKVDVGDVTQLVGVILNGGGAEEPFGEAKTISVGTVSFTMLPVEGGTFQMGSLSTDEDAWEDEMPQHQVTLSDFYMGETEVTQALWKEVMGNNPSFYPHDDQLPVEQVSWNDCQEFITKLNEMTGKTFRLPTEAEWEYAARGGNKGQGHPYAGSQHISSVAWYTTNSNYSTHPVATKTANELGLYDMSGNVCEWCSDWFGDYPETDQTNPAGAASGYERVYRGGAFSGSAALCRVATRYSYGPYLRIGYLGLRLVMEK